MFIRRCVVGCAIAIVSHLCGWCIVVQGQIPYERSSAPAAILPQTATSDPQAISIMQSTLAHLGGVEEWRGIRSAETHVTVTRPDGTSPKKLYMLDDWSTDNTRFRRRSPAFTGAPVDHNGSGMRVIHSPKGMTAVPEFDQARVLLQHLPGASLEIILRKPEYLVKSAKNRFCASSSQCVDVYRKNPHGPTLKEQEWTISTETGLPMSVRYAGLSLMSSSMQVWEKIDFGTFQKSGNVLVPGDAMLGTPNGHSAKFTFDPPAFNQPYDTKKFDAKEIQ